MNGWDGWSWLFPSLTSIGCCCSRTPIWKDVTCPIKPPIPMYFREGIPRSSRRGRCGGGSRGVVGLRGSVCGEIREFLHLLSTTRLVEEERWTIVQHQSIIFRGSRSGSDRTRHHSVVPSVLPSGPSILLDSEDSGHDDTSIIHGMKDKKKKDTQQQQAQRWKSLTRESRTRARSRPR